MSVVFCKGFWTWLVKWLHKFDCFDAESFRWSMTFVNFYIQGYVRNWIGGLFTHLLSCAARLWIINFCFLDFQVGYPYHCCIITRFCLIWYQDESFQIQITNSCNWDNKSCNFLFFSIMFLIIHEFQYSDSLFSSIFIQKTSDFFLSI